MKFIDEKGRLFGKLNLIDLLVILMLIAAVCAVVWKVGGKKAAEAATAEKLTVKYTVVCEDVPKSVCDFASSQIGKTITNSGKSYDATVTDVQVEPSTVTEGHENVFISVEGPATYSNYVYTVGNQEVRVGLQYIFKTSEFELTGIVSDMEVTHG
jgi:hypothetical protein